MCRAGVIHRIFRIRLATQMSKVDFTKLPLFLSESSVYVNQVGDEASREKGISRLLKSATKS